MRAEPPLPTRAGKSASFKDSCIMGEVIDQTEGGAEGMQPLLIVVAGTLVALAGAWAVLVGIRAHDRLALGVGSVVFVVCCLVVALFVFGPS